MVIHFSKSSLYHLSLIAPREHRLIRPHRRQRDDECMYDAGVDVKTAAYFMGHKDIETTLRIYTHLTEERSKRGAEAMVGFLNAWTPLTNKAMQKGVTEDTNASEDIQT